MPLPSRVLVVIPAFNEEATLAGVVAEVRAALRSADVLVVDDCSTDRTRAVALAAAVQVLTLPINLGVGGAMRAGFRYALRYGYDAVLQVDGDGQHDPQDAPRLIAALADADLVIGGVLLPGAKAPKLVTRAMISSMRPGSVVVDVAIDQGGCIETAKPTSHSDPIYHVDGVIHYCVTNMPGAVPRTSTLALSNVTLPYGLQIAGLGLKGAVTRDPALAKGVNVLNGQVTYQAVADAFRLPYTPLGDVL